MQFIIFNPQPLIFDHYRRLYATNRSLAVEIHSSCNQGCCILDSYSASRLLTPVSWLQFPFSLPDHQGLFSGEVNDCGWIETAITCIQKKIRQTFEGVGNLIRIAKIRLIA